jgi:hypothetical protein
LLLLLLLLLFFIKIFFYLNQYRLIHFVLIKGAPPGVNHGAYAGY